MPTTVTLKNLASFAGATNLQLFLRKTSDNTLLAAGGDTGVDADSIGSFAWTVDEAIPNEQLLARIYEGATETAATIVIDSVLNVGFTEIGQEAAELNTTALDPILSELWTEEQREYILEQLALLTVSGASVVVTAGVYMCARGDVEQVYGNANTATWADLNNNQNSSEITSRINYHIAIADNYVRSVLTQGAWVMPVEGDTIPAILAYNCARLAGVLLYEGRGVTDYDPKGRAIHQLSNHKNGVDSFLKSVVYGSTDLSPLVKSSTNEAPTAS